MNDNLRGAGWMTASQLGYVFNDAMIKWAAEGLPLFQAVFLRGCAIIVLLCLVVRARQATTTRDALLSWPLALRVSLESCVTVLYLLALTRVPLASLSAILQLVPIAVTFVAARLLREQVSVVRVAAVVAGFVGVLFVIRPGSDSFSPWLLMGLIVAAVVVLREVATRGMDHAIPGSIAALVTAVAITIMGLGISLVQGWESPEPARLAGLAVAALFLSLGYVGSINAVRIGDLSFSAPFRYSVLVFAIVLQIVVFGDVPDAWTFLGAAIITAAGLAALRTARPTDGLDPEDAAVVG